MTPADILKEARRLIAEKGWCQGTRARDADGNSCWERGPHAASFCIMGALFATSDDSTTFDAQHYLGKVTSGQYGLWNDVEGRTKSDVLAAFDKAIALAEQFS